MAHCGLTAVDPQRRQRRRCLRLHVQLERGCAAWAHQDARLFPCGRQRPSCRHLALVLCVLLLLPVAVIRARRSLLRAARLRHGGELGEDGLFARRRTLSRLYVVLLGQDAFLVFGLVRIRLPQLDS